jgi:hypothetical protein
LETLQFEPDESIIQVNVHGVKSRYGLRGLAKLSPPIDPKNLSLPLKKLMRARARAHVQEQDFKIPHIVRKARFYLRALEARLEACKDL